MMTNAAIRSLPSAKGRLQQGVDRLREEDAIIARQVISDALNSEMKIAEMAGDPRALSAVDRIPVLRVLLGMGMA